MSRNDIKNLYKAVKQTRQDAEKERAGWNGEESSKPTSTLFIIIIVLLLSLFASALI